MADALAAMLGNPGMLAAMGQRARAKVEALYSQAAFAEAGGAALTRLARGSACGSKSDKSPQADESACVAPEAPLPLRITEEPAR